eukprot:TRINITY_DN76188_c0_g1_i1.p1 TRINITY_DN76188_c0_g1~~TRINITY_DN76188_c0_g1_i1.p1  ORF type:complete len:528 (-),score=78.59 TRINITY_DN76188_c0_g1_i1:193-1689(-)
MGVFASSPAAAEDLDMCGWTNDGPRSSVATAPVALFNVERLRQSIGTNILCGRFCSSRSVTDKYDVSKVVLGSGRSGGVVVATDKADGRACALKRVNVRRSNSQTKQNLVQEVEIFLSLNHPQVVRLETIFEFGGEIAMVMELVSGGDLANKLAVSGRFTEKFGAVVASQMVSAVAYLHNHGIVHRDLKLDHFLFEKPGSEHLKLIDFGLAKRWNGTGYMTEACGSMQYVAPEVLARRYTDKADAWSIGICVCWCITGASPFPGSDQRVLAMIRNGKPKFASYFQRLSADAQDFVLKLLVANPEHRLSVVEAIAHDYLLAQCCGSQLASDGSAMESPSVCMAERYANKLQCVAWATPLERVASRLSTAGTLPETFPADLCGQFSSTSLQSVQVGGCGGVLSYGDLLAADVLYQKLLHDEQFSRKAFERLDADCDGRLSEADLRHVFGLIREGDEAEVFETALGMTYQDFCQACKQGCFRQRSASKASIDTCSTTASSE